MRVFARRFQIRSEPGLVSILPLIAMLTKKTEMLQPDAFCEHTMQQNATAARAPSQTPLGELTVLSLTPWLVLKGKAGEGKGKGEEGQEGRGRKLEQGRRLAKSGPAQM